MEAGLAGEVGALVGQGRDDARGRGLGEAGFVRHLDDAGLLERVKHACQWFRVAACRSENVGETGSGTAAVVVFPKRRLRMQDAARTGEPRTITAAGAAALVRSGDWLDYGITLCQPDTFDRALAARRGRVGGGAVRACITEKTAAALATGP